MKVRVLGAWVVVALVVAAISAGGGTGTGPSANFFTPYCASGATNVTTAAAARTAILGGGSACVTADITGDITLSGLAGLTKQGYFGTAPGVRIIGRVDIHGSHHITVSARANSVDMNGGAFLIVDNSVLGGTGPNVTERIGDQLINAPSGACADCAVTHTEMAYTYGDWIGTPTTVNTNSGYACRCTADLARFRFTGNWVHDVSADGLQGIGGDDAVIDGNQIGPAGQNPFLPNADHTGYGAVANTQHTDNIQITGNNDRLKITNNWLWGQGLYDFDDGQGLTETGGSGAVYIHGNSGQTFSLTISNNLIINNRGRMEVCNFGSGGVDRQNVTITNNTIYNNGRRNDGPLPGFEWDCDTDGAAPPAAPDNRIDRNIAVDGSGGFAQDGTLGTYSASDNVFGQLNAVTLNAVGNCTSGNCTNAQGQPIGFRTPIGDPHVWWTVDTSKGV